MPTFQLKFLPEDSSFFLFFFSLLLLLSVDPHAGHVMAAGFRSSLDRVF